MAQYGESLIMSYGTIWVDLQGLEVLSIERDILQHPQTGGVLLFTKNYSSRTQLVELIQAIRVYARRPILIGVDHEGGSIWRFGEDFWRPGSARAYGELYRNNELQALAELESAGYRVASELIECGLDLTFAPVLDLDYGVSTVIADRSYGADPTVVVECGRAFIRGLRAAGMGCVGKHFPGHGGCVMDSHFTQSIDMRARSEIMTADIVPFQRLNRLLTAIMPAHVIYPEVDALPAGFSKVWLQDILRDLIGFTGAIISDCLSMHGAGVLDNLTAGAQQALTAGCDMVIMTQQPREVLLDFLHGIEWVTTVAQQQRISGLVARNVQEKVAPGANA